MRRPDDEFPLSLDSFLDIVSNLIGVMVLVAVLAVVSSQNIAISLGTPVLSDPPEDAKRVLFECRRNRVLLINEERINKNIEKCIDDYKQRAGAKPDIKDLPEVFEQADVGDSCYRVSVEVFSGVVVVLVYTPRSDDQGETTSSIRSGSSDFADHVRSLDPEKHFAYFFVREDSFEVFRAARKIARDHGLSTGWNPIESEDELKFSSFGEAPQVQP